MEKKEKIIIEKILSNGQYGTGLNHDYINQFISYYRRENRKNKIRKVISLIN